METPEADLKAFGALICRIANQKARLTREESREAYRQVILNLQPELQQGAFLMAHVTRGPTREELAGAWEAMDQLDTRKIRCLRRGPVCDIVGTGSDTLKTIDCSTPASLIASACGLSVAKKGARYVTGVAGSTDLYEKSGIDVNAPLEQAEKALNECGYCYLSGENFMKGGWARLIKSMRFTSAFNLVGPLTKPCEETSHILVGSCSPHICNMLAEILRDVGYKAALTVYGMVDGKDLEAGMDEISPCGETLAVELSESGKTESYVIRPEDFGAKPCRFEAIASGPDAASNAARVMEILRNRKAETPEGSFFCLNAAALLKLSGLATDWKLGYLMAMQALASGKAHEKFLQFKSHQGLPLAGNP